MSILIFTSTLLKNVYWCLPTCRFVDGSSISVAPQRRRCLSGKQRRRWFPHSSSEAVSLQIQRRSTALQSASMLALGELAAAAIAVRHKLWQRAPQQQQQEGRYKSVPLNGDVGLQLSGASPPTSQAAAACGEEAGAAANLGLHRRARLASLVRAELGASGGGRMSMALAPAEMSHQLGSRSSRGAWGSVLSGHGWLPEEEARSSELLGGSLSSASLASRQWGLESNSLQVLPGQLEVMLKTEQLVTGLLSHANQPSSQKSSAMDFCPTLLCHDCR